MKEILRTKLLQQRCLLSADKVREDSYLITNNIRTLLKDYQLIVGIYHPIKSEVDITNLRRDFQCALPCLEGDSMIFRLWKDDDNLMTVNGIQQPQSTTPLVFPKIILTPCAGFDRNGNRLGYGKGFYDKYYAIHTDTLKIAVAYATQETPSIPIQIHDIKMDYIITEKEIINVDNS